jgi:hypothetical protein
MAEIITIDGKKFKSNKELVAYTNAQYLALQASVEKINKLEEEITHLQQMLASMTPLVGKTERIIKSPELCIVEAQIDILQNRALQKELTLEEVKVLDLLIKNKKLLSNEPTTINGTAKHKKDYSEDELLKLARIGPKDE